MAQTRNFNSEMEEALKVIQLEFDQKLESQNKIMMDMMNKIMKKVVDMQKSKSVSEIETDEDPDSQDKEEESSEEESDGIIGKSAPTNGFRFSPKVEFPTFEGQNAKLWIQKCERYFTLFNIPDNQKVNLASLYLEGRAASWFGHYIGSKKRLKWKHFIADVNARFKDNLSNKVVERFNSLKHTGLLKTFIDEFETLKAAMIQRNPKLPSSYFLDCFLAALKPTVKSFVKAFNPKNMAEAIEIARLQDETVEAFTVQAKSANFQKIALNKPILPTPNQPPKTVINPYKSSGTPVPRRFVSASERAEKRAKGLCYYCDQPYNKEHVCNHKGTQFFLVEITGNQLEEDKEEEIITQEGNVEYNMQEEEPLISFHAINGYADYRTMRLNGL
ncbi:unnamed protein product [Cuscuta epithymum]|uniref:Ty3 transposon capsid-like protein domain-containing protein n=1 Tax=Cuscuta epithymum TaxID=186058 RepID=A0AAV0DAD2_9ASTE|nr:unnamed protein product [Cuscuta epithymum]